MSDNDPYVYPGTSVLKNKLNIRDQVSLDRAERRLVAQRLADGSPTGDFNLQHLQAIHFQLFQDVYDWAGQVRKVQIAKGGDVFQPPRFIETGMADIHRRLQQDRFLAGCSPSEFADKAGRILGDINYVHPFREGNGRTQRAYLERLAEHVGHRIDFERIQRNAWMDACRAAHHGNYAPITQCIRQSLVQDRVWNQPRVWIVCGPNGAGKSTLVERFNRAGLPIVNPDTVAEENPTLGRIGAGREALRSQQQHLKAGNSFIVETTFSGRRPTRIIEDAKRHGFKVNLIFVAVKSPALASLRVDCRITVGGHAVPKTDIYRRFARCIENVADGIRAADRALMLDNSGKTPVPVARFERGKRLWLSKGIPAWTERTSLRRFFAKAPENSRKKEQDLER